MKRLHWTVAKNALSNAVRGGATAIVAVALPHFLAHNLDRDRFAAWSLILQIAAYASFLDFGLQTAVARFIAQALELEQHERVSKLIQTALAMLSLAAALALAIIGLVVYYAGSFFHGVPPSLLLEFQTAAMLMALGTAVLLPLSTFTGVLVGMHENEFTAYAIGGSRLVGAALAIVASRHTQSLTIISLCIILPNFAGGLLQMVIVRYRLVSARIRRISIDRKTATAYLSYCAGLTVWAVSMLLISGLDITIVGHYRFESVGYYAIAATLTSIFASANSSVLSAFLAPFSAMQASGRLDQMRMIVIRATRINCLFNMGLTAIVIAYGEPLLRIWVGSVYAREAYPVVAVLMIAQTVRLVGSAYAIALIATGYQNSSIMPAVIEATFNLALSLYFILRYGAIGVAYGSLIASVIAIPALFILTVRTREGLTISRVDLGFRGIAGGIIPLLPACAWAAYYVNDHPPSWLTPAGWLVSIGCAYAFLRLLSASSQSPKGAQL